MTKPTPLMSAEEFADRARVIVETMRGHAAHRAIDLLTNDVLRGLGYGERHRHFSRMPSATGMRPTPPIRMAGRAPTANGPPKSAPPPDFDLKASGGKHPAGCDAR